MGFLYSQFFARLPYPTSSFANQTVIVTGSNSGLGLEAARHFTRLDAAKVILAVRNLPEGEEAKKSIEASTKRSNVVEVWKLDLASFDSVKAFAKKATSELDRLDVLMLNASIAAGSFRQVEGFESSITVNVISTFLLLFLLLPLAQSTSKVNPPPALAPRICVVSSEVHTYYPLPPSEFPEGAILSTMSEKWVSEKRYPESKLLQVLLVRAIAPLLAQSGLILNMLNPGLCHSKLSRDGPWSLEIIKFFIARSTEVGSRTLLASAVAGQESHGKYMSDCVVDSESKWVLSEEGKIMQGRVWEEVRVVLEKISPGCTKV